MIKFILGFVTFLFFFQTRLWAGVDQITQADFDSYVRYGRSSISLKENWEEFVVQKLKAADAMSRGWDTLPSFIQLYKHMQGEVVKSFWASAVQEKVEPAESQCGYRMEQWFFPLSQQASLQEERKAVSYMDSVFGVIQKGDADTIFSQCHHSVKWYTQEYLLKEFQDCVRTLNINELSRPFISPLGIHIVRILQKEESKEQQNDAVDLESVWPDAGVCWSLCADEKVKIRLRGVRDSLLATCWDYFYQTSLQAEKIEDEKLSSYFLHHRSEYKWELPHFKGAVIFCKDKREASRVKKYLKKHDFYDWESALLLFRKKYPGSQVCMDIGLFQIGKNPYVDKLAFKCGQLPDDTENRYVFVFGKRLNKGPESYKDVYGEVLEDYQHNRYILQIQDMRQRFPLDFDSEVLKTVNCCGSN